MHIQTCIITTYTDVVGSGGSVIEQSVVNCAIITSLFLDHFMKAEYLW